MGFNRFSVLLSVRIGAILLSLMALGYFILTPGYHAATLLLVCAAALLTYEVFRFVSRTNQEITRFLDAARYADFGQRFTMGSMGAGFEELGNSLSEILERFRQQRTDQEGELRHLKALLEQVPVPLVSLHADDSITMWNNTARRLFADHHVTTLSDLADFGDEFATTLEHVQPGERRLVTFELDGLERRLTVAASQLVLEGKTERLISLQDIQSELDGTQLDAWQELVRVLTHEIMNSITPVASLARTTTDLVADASSKVTDNRELAEELDEIKGAVDTVARRSDSLMNFVSSYRRLTRLPEPERSRFRLEDLFRTVADLTSVDYSNAGVTLNWGVEPSQLDIDADRGMIEQVLINLLANAKQALAGVENPSVTLGGRLNKRGHVVITVEDNGGGIDHSLRHKVFVPFYTTRREGSGVGLALSRQIMIAHGGTVAVGESKYGGALFTLTF